MTLNQLLDQATRQFPDDTAVKGTGFTYTYREFHAASEAFAAHLVDCGVSSHAIVGICLERSPEMMVGIFGILKAGAAYMPIDPSHPPQRIASLIAESGCTCVVTTADRIDFVKSFGCKAIVPFLGYTSTISTSDLPVTNDDDTAYILFTSGSEGMPKGVMIAHHSVVNLVSYIQDQYPISRGDVVLLKSPYTFDGSVWELFGWIIMGGTLCVAPPGAEKDPKQLWEILHREKIAFLFFVPPMLGAFLGFSSFGGPVDGLSLKWVSVGGEVLPASLVKRFYEVFDYRKTGLINVYGPTETTVYAITYLCAPESAVKKIPIGFPVTNDAIYIMDDEGQELPAGVEGEIWIGGAGVARGYLNNPDLTRQKFVPDHFRGKGLIYRTGDLGYKNEDGTFDFVGRKDLQVKLRGLRIELGEIEYALSRISEIAECAVTFSKDHNQDDCIVAYVRLIPGPYQELIPGFVPADDALDHDLREQLGNWLPDYMIPSRFIRVSQFPLTPHEKIDRKALPPLTSFPAGDRRVAWLPETETGRIVLRLWQQVLGARILSPEDDFFSAGGHSLKAIQLIALIIEEFSVEVPLHRFYEGLTLQEMADGIEQKTFPEFRKMAQPLPPEDPLEALPITPVQTEMWILHSLDPSGLVHNIQVEFTISGRPDPDRLRKALRETMEGEEIFRSVFKPLNGVPYRFVSPTLPFQLNQTDLSSLENDEKQQTYDRICYANGRILFNTEILPLFSLHLVTWSPLEYKLLLSIHHLIFDGWSLFLFMERFSHHYSGRLVTPNDWRISDYVNYLHQPEVQEKITAERQYWLKELHHLPRRWFLPLKEDAQPETAGQHGDRYWWDCSRALSDAIDQTALQLRTTPFALFMTAFQLSLASANRMNDVVVGTPFANRTIEIVNSLIGYYTNMVSIRLRWHDDPTLAGLVSRCSTKAINAFSNAAIPFGEIARSVGAVSDLGSNPVYQAIFVMQNWPHNDIPFEGFSLRQREIGNFTAKTDFLLNVEKSDGAYICWLEYDTMLYSESTTKRLAQTISHCLDLITMYPGRTVSSVQEELWGIIHDGTGYRCHVAGEGRLAAHCIERLEQKGFLIDKVISNDPWLHNRFPERCVHGSVISSTPQQLGGVDYIFSINNSLVLKQEFLALASGMAINYHDAPLPRYAGMYATNWAILEGSSSHGISWHQITGMIDGGDLLVTAPVAVLPDDTALTLNTRCFEAAIETFETLVDDILQNRVKPVPQDLTLRTWFPLAMRPALFGSLAPSMPAREADRLLRAMHSGHGFDNEFALPWLFADGALFIIGEAKSLAGEQGQPGTFRYLNGTPGFYCHDGFIAVTSLYDILGHPVDLHQRFSATSVMDPPDQERCIRAAEYFKTIARYEPFWKNQFEQAGFLSWPFLDGDRSLGSVEYKLDAEQQRGINLQFEGQDPKDVLASSVLLVLFHLCDLTSGTVGYLPALPEDADDGFFSPWVPFHSGLPEDISASDAIGTVITSLTAACKAKTFVRSLPLRFQQLRSYAGFLPEITISGAANAPDGGWAKINLVVSGDSVSLSVTDPHQFPGAPHFLHCFSNWLNNMLADPGLPLRQISCVDYRTSEESWSPSPIPSIPVAGYPDVSTVFMEKAASFPDATAVYDTGQLFTYHRFSNDILSLAAVLSSRNVTSEDVVAIAIGRTYHYMVSVMAVLHQGACFLPIDPAMPAGRISFILEDAGASLMLVDDDETLTGNTVARLNVTSISDVPKAAARIPATEYSGAQPAYILYTSGSTGRPKGVVISRANLSAFTAAVNEVYHIGPNDNVLQFANLSFDASIEEIFCSFCSGAGLYLRTDEMLQPAELLEFSMNQHITVWDLPTAYWRQVVQSEEYKRRAGHTSLRLVIIGGEAVLPADIAAWSEVAVTHQLVNTYGPTETTVVALTYPVPSALPEHGVVPIGAPLRCCIAAVVNSSNLPVPAGIAGELLISGDTVALGYLNRHEEEQKAFAELFFQGDALKRWYRTGDRVFEDTLGHLCFLGRKDKQVKIRGFRVEPSEIEQQISRIQGISGSAVLVMESKTGLSLAAFYATSDRQPLAVDVKEILGHQLPSYMVPVEIHFIETIPLTSNGKADMAALREIAQQSRKREHDQSGNPVTPTEQFVHSLWQEILDMDNPGVNDDFFELGGHSLKAVQLMAEIKKQRGMTIPLATLLQNSTIRTFAACIDAKTNPFQWNCLVPIRKEGDRTPLFLIHGAGMNVLLYQSLVRHLSTDRPIYAFQAAGLDGRRPLKESIEAMAGEYLEEMLTIQPEGPWCMLGFSLGGFIAFEMAQKLAEKGHHAGFTGMIDSVAYLADFTTSPGKKLFVNAWSSFARPLYTLWLLLMEPAEGKGAFLVHKLKRLRLSVILLLTRTGMTHQRNLQKDLERQDYLSDKVLIYMNEVLRKYRLREARFPIDLFAAGKPTFYIFDRKWYGWKPFARNGFRKHILPGEHSMLFAPPNDAVFAVKLEERLNELENNPIPP